MIFGGGFGAFLSPALEERDGKTICREVMVILSCETSPGKGQGKCGVYGESISPHDIRADSIGTKDDILSSTDSKNLKDGNLEETESAG